MLDEALALAAGLAAGPLVALAAAKRVIDEGVDATLATALDARGRRLRVGVRHRGRPAGCDLVPRARARSGPVRRALRGRARTVAVPPGPARGRAAAGAGRGQPGRAPGAATAQPAGPALPGIRPTALPAKGEADWYRRGVFYEVLTRGFFDSNDDGIGDLAGLRAKLDYLEWLGVDCLWLLPFYPSPMRDGGYDISDFFTVHAELGSSTTWSSSSTTPTAAGSG